MQGTGSWERPTRSVWQRIVRFACVLALVAGYVPLGAAPAYAAPLNYTGGADQTPAKYILNDHTAYAFHVTAAPGSFTPGTIMGVSAKLSDTGAAGGFTTAPGFTWKASAGRWIQSREDSGSDATITIDPSGGASGWYFFKCGDENFTGFPAGNGHGANQAYLTVQIQNYGASGSWNPTLNPIVTVLDAKTQGAWVHNGVATGALAGLRANATSSVDATMFGSQLTEPNGCDDNDDAVIDNEDYGPAGSTGDFRIGVPAASGINVDIDGAPWAPGQGVTAGPADTDVAVGAADHVAPTAPSTLTATPGNAKVSLSWTAATDSGGSDIAGYRVYRRTGLTYATQGTGDPALTTSLPVLIATTDDETTTFTDNTAVNGTTYYYYVRAFDGATNSGPRSMQVSALPVTPALVTTISGVTAGWSKTAETFSLTATGGVPPIATHYVLNGGADNVYSAPVLVSAQGTTTVTYFSTDSLPQTETAHTATITIDGVAPVSSLSGVTSGNTYSGPVSLQLSATDAVSGVQKIQYVLDSVQPTSTYTVPIPVNSIGAHSLVYWAMDNASNKESAHTATFTISAAPPVTTASGIPAGWSTSTVTFSLSATGSATPLRTFYALGAGAVTTYTVPVAVSTQGTTTLSYFSIDSLNQRETTKTATIRVDTGMPNTISDVSVDYLNTAVIHLSATDNAGGSGVAHTFFKLDGGAQTEGLTITATGVGSHSIEFWSVDVAGNEESPHKTANFVIDDTLAPTTISDASATYLNSATIHLSATDNVGGSGVAHTFYQIDSGALTEGLTASVSTYGSHSIEFWSVDVAGNIESHRVANFFVDENIAPTTTSNAVASYVGVANIHLTATDNVGGSGVAHTFFRLDGSGQTEGTTAIASGLGAHSLEFWSVDVATNEELPHHIANFTITSPDTIAPTTTSDAVASYVGTATIHLTAVDNVGGSGVAHTFYRLDGLAEVEGTTVVATGVGSHSLEFWSVDAASNAETPRHTVTFTITAAAKTPTSITIGRSASSVRLPSPFILSGVLSPGNVGDLVVVYVKKPGSARWSYSSARLCYASDGHGGALWWYRYTPVLRGTYSFYVAFAGDATRATSRSLGTIAVLVR